MCYDAMCIKPASTREESGRLIETWKKKRIKTVQGEGGGPGVSPKV